MQTIPLIVAPSQTLSVVLAGQRCKIAVYQKEQGLFLDLTMGDQPIVTAIICRDRVRLARYAYLGFVGNLAFMDTQGTDDPVYTGFDGRFKLVYGS